ncbi:hypothetical protein [Bradyrhizobium sp. DASA03007]|uniref:hypothetical protein n=1 Tax=unclassified Bradyrhizobium TaxID=2631580 RepID=UPI003F6F4A03
MALLSFVESAPRAYRLKVGNADLFRNSTEPGTSPELLPVVGVDNAYVRGLLSMHNVTASVTASKIQPTISTALIASPMS